MPKQHTPWEWALIRKLIKNFQICYLNEKNHIWYKSQIKIVTREGVTIFCVICTKFYAPRRAPLPPKKSKFICQSEAFFVSRMERWKLGRFNLVLPSLMNRIGGAADDFQALFLRFSIFTKPTKSL